MTRDSGQISARPGILKLEFSANALSQLAKDNVTRDYTPISAPSKEPVTRATPNNLKWYSILLSDLFDDIYKFINLHLGVVFFVFGELLNFSGSTVNYFKWYLWPLHHHF